MTLLGKIRLIFIIAALGIGLLFGLAYHFQIDRFQSQLMDRFLQVAPFCHAQIAHTLPGSSQTEPLLSTGGFALLSSDDPLPVRLAHTPPLQIHTMPMGQAEIYRYKSDYYLKFHTAAGDQWLRNTQSPPRALSILGWYGIALLALGLLYLWLARSLHPLHTLHRAVEQIKHGDLSVRTRQPRRDEIAQVANTLDEALRRIESLIDSRQLFLHAIMHELKTPIAKGKLLNAFLDEGDNRRQYEALFDRLDLLLGEFAQIEQMLTAHYRLRPAEYRAEDLIDQALELMLLDPQEATDQITQDLASGATLHTDFNLFTLMLKNLIDNALTHSPDHHATLTVTAEHWTITNTGTPLPHPLEAWREPFGASSGGLGLGLYIALNIADVLGMELRYVHQEGVNIFSLLPQES